jgi:hypothetical protein
MIVILQGEALAGIDHNPLDDVALAYVQNVPCAPWPLVIVSDFVKATRLHAFSPRTRFAGRTSLFVPGEQDLLLRDH